MNLIAFNLGLPKSGTSTLQNAFARSGLKSLHWHSSVLNKYIGRAMYERFLKDEPIMTDFPDAAVVTQADLITYETSFWPQMDQALLRQLKRENPRVRFILPIRSPELIADSFFRWGDLKDRIMAMGAPGLPPRMVKNKNDISRWVVNHYDNCREMFDDLIEYEIDDPTAPQLLSRELGVEIKWWGHSNKNTGQVDHLKKV